MATHSSILAWRIPWTEEPGGLQPWGHRELDITEWLTHTQERRADGRTWAHEDFVGGPHVAKMPHSQSRRPEFDLWSGNWIPHAATKSFHAPTKTQCSQISKYYKKKRKRRWAHGFSPFRWGVGVGWNLDSLPLTPCWVCEDMMLLTSRARNGSPSGPEQD